MPRKRSCPGCGAPLPAPDALGHATCSYCGAVNRVTSTSKSSSNPLFVVWKALAAHPSGAMTLIFTALSYVVVISPDWLSCAVDPQALFEDEHDESPPPPIAPEPAAPPPTSPPPTLSDHLLKRYDAYVLACIEQIDERVLASRSRYRAWVDDEAGPKLPHDRPGIFTFGPFPECNAAVTGIDADVPELATLDAAIKDYLVAANMLMPHVDDAAHYYSDNQPRRDGLARGRALHRDLQAGFERFLAARSELMKHVDRAFEILAAACRRSLPPDAHLSFHLLDLVENARAIALVSNVHHSNIADIDHAKLHALLERYERKIAEFEVYVMHDVDLLQYAEKSRALLGAGRRLAARVARGGAWSARDKRRLARVQTQRDVKGSPAAVLFAYNDLPQLVTLNTHDKKLPRAAILNARYIAPVGLLTDGY